MEWASVDERRSLLRHIRMASPERNYAEFLAAFSPASSGVPNIARHFPGYTAFLAQVRLDISASHLVDVFMMQSRGSSNPTHRIAEEVVPAALALGLGDPTTLLDLLDLVAESPKGDSLLNTISAEVEDEGFIGAERFSHEQRLALFGRALDEARARGHDTDGEEAFDRVVRERMLHGEIEALRTLCHDLATSFKAIRHCTLEVALELALEAGEPFEELLDSLLALAARPEADLLRREVAGLALAYPDVGEYLAERGNTTSEHPAEGELAGRRVVIVGGHAWLKKNALPILQGGWGADVEWLDPTSAKNGSQAVDLARGTADLVVVNTACIGHSAAARVTREAQNSGLPYVFQNSRGVGALLACVRGAFEGGEGEAAPRKVARAAQRKKLLR
jgi:hypothetical protein